MATNATPLKLLDTKPKRATHTSVDTLLITPAIVKSWKNPPFQRPLHINDKVRALADQIKDDGGVLPGVITIGVLGREEYLLDGQHRREAFLLSECAEGFTDVRKHFFDDMAEMGSEFVSLNSQLVRMRPDDILRGLEGSNEAISAIRKACPFVGYDMIRRGERSPMLSMSAVLRAWGGSSTEVPATGGQSAAQRAAAMTEDDAQACVEFLKLADKAWGRDAEYARLWSGLNLIITMWLYRRTVITPYSPRTPKLSKEMFCKCMLAMSADQHYVDWLVARLMSDRNRGPCYARIKNIFAARIQVETGKRPSLPQPAWAHHTSALR